VIGVERWGALGKWDIYRNIAITWLENGTLWDIWDIGRKALRHGGRHGDELEGTKAQRHEGDQRARRRGR